MPSSLKRLVSLFTWRRANPGADDLYAEIMAQTRLPIYYQRLGVPDTLEGRFVMLSLHLFGVLHRLRGEGDQAASTAQALSNIFSNDMETVLREIGTSDLKVPKKVRKLIAQGATLIEGYEQTLDAGDGGIEQEIAAALPLDQSDAEATAAKLGPYVTKLLQSLESQPVERLCSGRVEFPNVSGE